MPVSWETVIVIKETLTNYIQIMSAPSVVWGIGWFAHYIYKVSKGEKFRWSMMIINMILASWLGSLVANYGASPWLISLTGFCTYPILAILEKKGSEIVLKYLNGK